MICIHFFNYYGYYSGTYYPREHYNSGYMILKQAEHYTDESKRLSLAKSFIEGSYKNILKVLGYYENRGKAVSGYIENVEKYSSETEKLESIPELMAIEGNIREQYYRAFDSIIEDDDFVFQERSKRPPRNELNSLISFGNSMLYVQVLSEIYKTHLDPRIGYLHSTNFRKFSLNLDLAEIFKPIIVDRIIFSLLGKGMLKKKDFEKGLGGIALKDKGRKLFVEQFDERLKSTIQHRELGRNVSYRRLIRMEAYKLQKHFMDEKEYSPFISRW